MADKKSKYEKAFKEAVKEIIRGKLPNKSLKAALKAGIKIATVPLPIPKRQRKIPKDITRRSPVIRKVPTRKKPSK